MAEHHQDRYIPARINDGWPIAGGVVTLAVICILAVIYIHRQTYVHPTDVTAGAGKTTHGAAAATTDGH